MTLITRRKFLAAGATGMAGLSAVPITADAFSFNSPQTKGESTMKSVLSETELKELQKFDAPTISNAIEPFNIRSRDKGFMSPEVKCIFPEFPPLVGYAVTAKIRATQQTGKPTNYISRKDWWEFIRTIPKPRVVVIQDLDEPKAIGSYWGEVNANVHKALGCVGVVTDGGVRDLPPVRELGFHFFAGAVIVSHAYVNLVEIGTPVVVGGLSVKPGDLLFGDMHGVINIPHEISKDVAESARKIMEWERPIIEYCKSPNFTIEGLNEVFNRAR